MQKIILTTVMLLLTVGCGNYQNVKTPSTSPTASDQEKMEDEETNQDIIDFQTIRTEIIDSACIRCHQNYANYNVVKNSAQQILQSIVTERMPKNSGPLNAEQKALFRAWIAAGTPEKVEVVEDMPDTDEDNAGSDTDDSDNNNGDSPEPKAIAFAEIRERLLDANNCTSCHFEYMNYEFVFRDKDFISSAVISDYMPFPLQKGGPKPAPVSDEVKQLLLDWIAQGAPEFIEVTPTNNDATNE